MRNYNLKTTISVFVLLLYALLACSCWDIILLGVGIPLALVFFAVAAFFMFAKSYDDKKQRKKDAIKKSLDKNCKLDKGFFYYEFYINEEKSILSVISVVGDATKIDIPDVHKSSSVLIESDYFLLDDIEKYLLHVSVSKYGIDYKKIHVNDILGVDIQVRGHSVYNYQSKGVFLSGSVLGVGRMSGEIVEENNISDITVYIEIKDIENPIYTIPVAQDIDSDDQIKEYSQKIKMIIQAAMDLQDKEEEPIQNQLIQTSVSTELERLFELKERGILTEEDFLSQKKKLLS